MANYIIFSTGRDVRRLASNCANTFNEKKVIDVGLYSLGKVIANEPVGASVAFAIHRQEELTFLIKIKITALE